MSRRGPRKRIARCVYEDRIGRAGIYRRADGKPGELRFPPFTPISEIRTALERAQRRARGSGTLQSARGTLAAAVDRWARQEQHLVSWKERRAELRAWVALIGPKRLSQITPEDVRRAMSKWAQAGLAPKTIRNRLWTLRHLYHVILGPKSETPADDVEPPARVRVVPQPVTAEKILAVYTTLLEFERTGRLRDAKTRARFMVRAATGRRPCEIMRAQPEDVDLGQRVWRVRDAKGGWSEGIYLNDDMLVAWMIFAQAKAWGEFNTGSQAEVLRAAGWPERVRPYNLRHSVGIALSEAGIDLADVGAHLGHTRLETTRWFYVPILNSRMQRASQRLEGRLSGWSVPSPVPSTDATPCNIPQQNAQSAGQPKHAKTRAKR